MSNVKSGDLAVIIKSALNNAGRIVEVVSLLGECPIYDGFVWNPADGPCWLVRAQGGRMNAIRGGPYQMMPIPDAWLRPIRPDGITDEEVTELYRPSPIREVA